MQTESPNISAEEYLLIFYVSSGRIVYSISPKKTWKNQVQINVYCELGAEVHKLIFNSEVVKYTLSWNFNWQLKLIKFNKGLYNKDTKSNGKLITGQQPWHQFRY